MVQNTNPPIALPQIALQHDFLNVFADVRDRTIISEDIYLSCYRLGSPSVHGKVNVSIDDASSQPDALLLESRDGVQLTRTGSHTFTVSCPALSIENTTLSAPRQSINVNNPSGSVRRISAFDVSPDSNLIATGHLDGTISVKSASQTSSSVPLTTKKLHLSSVLSLRFFPSSLVLLSAASDFSLNIISTDPSPQSSFPILSVPRTLKGHKAAITDTAILGRGKNILSCSKDGSIRLWDVGEAARIGSSMVSDSYAPILKMSVGDGPSLTNPSIPSTEQELTPPNGEPVAVPTTPSDTEHNSVIYAVLQTGSFNIFDLRSRNVVYTSPKPPAVKGGTSLLSISHHTPSHLLATGSQKGIISLYDVRSLPSSTTTVSSGAGESRSSSGAIIEFQRSNVSVDDLLFVKGGEGTEPNLLVATEDGFPVRIGFSTKEWKPEILEEYVGFADEGVRVIRTNNVVDVWCAGDDGIVRRY